MSDDTTLRTFRTDIGQPEFISISAAAHLLGISKAAAFAEAAAHNTLANGQIPVVQLTQGSAFRRGRLGVARTAITRLTGSKVA